MKPSTTEVGAWRNHHAKRHPNCSYRPPVVDRATARLAQLELIAKLARKAVDLEGSPFDHAGHCLTLQLALVDLDNHPDTKADG